MNAKIKILLIFIAKNIKIFNNLKKFKSNNQSKEFFNFNKFLKLKLLIRSYQNRFHGMEFPYVLNK